MAYTYHELKEKTIQADISRKGAENQEAVQGYSQMNKEDSAPGALQGVGRADSRTPRRGGHHKPAIKAQIK